MMAIFDGGFTCETSALHYKKSKVAVGRLRVAGKGHREAGESAAKDLANEVWVTPLRLSDLTDWLLRPLRGSG